MDRDRDSGRHGPSIISRVVAGLQTKRKKKRLAMALVVVWITRRMQNCSGDTSAIVPGSAHVRSSSVSLSLRTLILVMNIFWKRIPRRSLYAPLFYKSTVSSDLSFHLPPAVPPLLLIALLPSRQAASDAVAKASGAIVRKSSFARRVSLTSLGVAIVSWAHYEIRQQKRLVPLPLREEYRDYKKALLPPFLPEALPPLEDSGGGLAAADEKMEAAETDEEIAQRRVKLRKEMGSDDALLSDDVRSRIKRELEYLYRAAPKPDTVVPTLQELLKKRMARARREEDIRRKTVVEELLALQALKKISRKKNGGTNQNADKIKAPLGYALVTGASRGIGRALAVELARYEIPLILVARNIGKLKVLADELVSCYGVPCCVLQADLSQPDAAAKVYRATKDAGLKVDILVNNAGICTHGEHVDTPLEDIEQMVQINAGSVATLSHLYGKDMKKQRRGRILFVSSVVGAVNAGPRVATYAATKAFEKSLSLSIGKELEQYGCAVTCLMPGAVKGTAFKSSSNTDDALCWKIPFYPAIAQDVAHRGVRAMLEGDPEVCPGLLNKIFLRVLTPMLPQRLTTLIVETAWNPLPLPWKQPPPRESTVIEEKAAPSKTASSRPFASFWEPSSERPRVLTTPSEKQPSKPLANEVDDDTFEADDNYFEILGVGDEEKAVMKDETSATEDNGTAAEKQVNSGEMIRDSQAGDETPVEKEKSEALPSGDPMVEVLAGEIEAGLVDVIPPPAEDRTTEGVNTETYETPGLESDECVEEKSEISALADDIEAEVMKLVPVPKEDEPADSPTPPDDKERSESPKSVIQERDLDLLLHVD